MTRIWRYLWQWLFIGGLTLLGSLPYEAQAQQSEVYADSQLEVTWLSSSLGLSPGAQQDFAFRVKLAKGWHIYWSNPGDSGHAPRLSWQEPKAYVPGAIAWPYPRKFPLPPLVNFGYEGEVFLSFPLQIPPSITADSQTLKIRLDWLVCEEECIPGHAFFSMTLPVGPGLAEKASLWRPFIEASQALVPRPIERWKLTGSRDAGAFHFSVDARDLPSEVESLEFFPFEGTGLASQGHVVQRIETMWDIRVPIDDVPPQVEPSGIIVGQRRTSNSQKTETFSLALSPPPALADSTSASLWMMLLFAFLGGLILNIMPCVLPVLSIKILGLVQESREEKSSTGYLALCYTAGVIASFLGLAGLLLLAKASGQAIGWGFQLQSPTFVAALACLFFLMAWSFLGIFSPWNGLTRAGNIGQKWSGASGQLASGVVAVLVASPCTGPFMGVALGYGLAQSAGVALLLFAVLGFGFAFPFLLLGFVPSWRRFLPKPGIWMEYMRQILAFPLFATVLWLLWVLAMQSGIDSVLATLAAFIFMGFGIWLLHLSQNLWARRFALLNLILGLALAISGPGYYGVGRGEMAEPSTSSPWSPFTPEALAALRREHPVFVDFTAAWCVSCQVNKKLVLERADVLTAFDKAGVRLLRADWTHSDPVIGEVLASFNRRGVPLYLLYPSLEGDPLVLPEVLTPERVFSALSDLKSQP